MSKQWYALRSKPNKEPMVYRQARAEGIEVFYPAVRVNPVNPRARKMRAYFPGYLFVEVDLSTVELPMLQWMPGAARLVSFGNEAASVPDALIAAIRQHVEKINATGGLMLKGLKTGDK